MLTGHTHIDQVRQARDAGINEFIAKPVSVKTMMQRLISVIEHPRPFVRTKSLFRPLPPPPRRMPNIAAPSAAQRRSAAQAAE